MNRKISTLFTTGLLMAGSLCGSAFAQKVFLPFGGVCDWGGGVYSTAAPAVKGGAQDVFFYC